MQAFVTHTYIVIMLSVPIMQYENVSCMCIANPNNIVYVIKCHTYSTYASVCA